MKSIKQLLFSILSEKSYLKLLHRAFYILFDIGLLKNDIKFKYHYKVKSFLEEDDVILDIGANLGYFAKIFSRIASKGKVICVEPLPQYFDVLHHFLGKKKNVTLHNVALGKEAGIATMILPMQDGMIRTGLPYIPKEKTTSNERTQEVNIVNPLKLIKGETKIDYIKCDIEGYEWIVFQELKPLIIKNMPIVQIEIANKNLSDFLKFFAELEYIQYGIFNHELIKEEGQQKEEGDYLFIPKSKEVAFLNKLK
tara:strand:- start:4085 stop:4843 length:759 start_codon:yes stop_codon:yes gene_type:complete